MKSSKYSADDYRLVHVFGYLNQHKIEDKLCLIINSGYPPSLDREFMFFWDFDDDDEFFKCLKNDNAPPPAAGLLITDYYEINEHLNKRWWHYSKSYDLIAKVKPLYSNRFGVIGYKLNYQASLPIYQKQTEDELILRWNYSSLGPLGRLPGGIERENPLKLKRLDLIEPLEYSLNLVYETCPFCGNRCSSEFGEMLRYLCSNCNKKWQHPSYDNPNFQK